MSGVCIVCGARMKKTFICKCGFDETKYYERYMTLAPIAENVVSDYQKHQDYIKELFSAYVDLTKPVPDFSMRNKAVHVKPSEENVIGKTLIFGNGTYPNEWIIVGKEDNRILVINKYAIEKKPFASDNVFEVFDKNTWEKGGARQWLNGAYFKNAFSIAEKKAIVESTVSTRDDKEAASDTITNDRIFALSQEEVEKYLPSSEMRKVTLKNGESVHWWLRDAGLTNVQRAIVMEGGEVFDAGYVVSDNNTALRPAMWLDIDKLKYAQINKLIGSIKKYRGKADGTSPIRKPESTVLVKKPTISKENSQTMDGIGTTTPPKYIGPKKVGDEVVFGHYRNSNKWIVLEKKNGKALLLSKNPVAKMPYNSVKKEVTWETSDIRHWLNDDYFKEAFDIKEMKSISKELIINSKKSYYGRKGGNNTTDRVFLLSYDEFDTYFPQYGSKRKDIVLPDEGYEWWWLRNPGNEMIKAEIVTAGHKVNHQGKVVSDIGLVRPAIWVDSMSI